MPKIIQRIKNHANALRDEELRISYPGIDSYGDDEDYPEVLHLEAVSGDDS